MEIRMYDVNFGEAIIYDACESKLLVDCGAKFQGKVNLAYDAIRRDFSFGKDEVLITHFDEDHYNGLIAMANDGKHIKRLYLPKYIYDKKKIHYTDNYFIEQLRSIMYLHALGKKQRLNSLKKLFVAIPKLISPNYNLKTVAYGDTINVGSAVFNILWPEEPISISFTLLSDRLRELCAESMVNDNASIELLDSVIDEYLKIFIDFYRLADGEGESNRNLEGQYAELVTQFERIHQRLENAEEQLHIVVSQENIKIIDSKLSNLIKSQNDCSVVFSYEKYILATGDASKKIIKYLCDEGRIGDYYELLKAPHHGTKAYYSSLLPDAKYVFISNSGDKKINWKISKEYPDRYGDKVYCTNDKVDRCEWLRGGNIQCHNCNIPVMTRVDPVRQTI